MNNKSSSIFHSNNLVIAIILTLVLSFILILGSISIGNISFFLFLNYDGGKLIDNSIVFISQLGETIPWVVALILVLFFKRKYLMLLISCFVISTIFVQGIKNLLPNQERPTKSISNTKLIHTVEGVELHKYFSFPSGHTATAFTIFYFACILISKRSIIILGILYAALVGYSRIYLAQHFPIDVAGGMLVAIVTIYLSLFLNERLSKRNLS